MQMKAGDDVYVRRGAYVEAAEVDHTYVSTNGTFCVSFTNGSNAPVSDVMTYDEYWDNPRAKLEENA